MAKLTDETRASLRRRSRLVTLGRDDEFSQGFINVPPFRGSTVLYPDVATLKSRAQRFTYGTRGTPTTEALCSAWTDLSGAAGTVLVPSGLAAIVVALMTALSAGDHMLMTDSVYRPARAFADMTLKRMGIETTYYDPAIGAGDRRADAAQHQGRVHRVAGLGDARDPGHSGDRRGRTCSRRLRHHGQHLGDAALLLAPRPWRRHGGRSWHQISLRPRGPAARPRLGQ